MATPTNYSACVRIPVLNFSWDTIFVVNVQPAKTAKFFNLENFRLYGIPELLLSPQVSIWTQALSTCERGDGGKHREEALDSAVGARGGTTEDIEGTVSPKHGSRRKTYTDS